MLDSAFVSYVAVMSITPGPNNLLLAASGVNVGWRRTLPVMVGIVIGGTALCALTTSLLAMLLNWVGVIRLPLAIVGCGYLFWLSWKIIRSGKPGERQSTQRAMGCTEGILFQAVNPKVWVMAMNVAILFTPPTGFTVQQTLGLCIGFALVNIPCVLVWVVLGDRLRLALQNEGKRRAFNYVMGGLMALTALWLIVDEGVKALA